MYTALNHVKIMLLSFVGRTYEYMRRSGRGEVEYYSCKRCTTLKRKGDLADKVPFIIVKGGVLKSGPDEVAHGCGGTADVDVKVIYFLSVVCFVGSYCEPLEDRPPPPPPPPPRPRRI